MDSLSRASTLARVRASNRDASRSAAKPAMKTMIRAMKRSTQKARASAVRVWRSNQAPSAGRSRAAAARASTSALMPLSASETSKISLAPRLSTGVGSASGFPAAFLASIAARRSLTKRLRASASSRVLARVSRSDSPTAPPLPASAVAAPGIWASAGDGWAMTMAAAKTAASTNTR